MIRFLMFLLGKPYETCKGCEVLREQLRIANEEKQLAINTLLDIMKPKLPEPEAAVGSQRVELPGGSQLWSRRREFLEQQDRIKAQKEQNGLHLAKPDNIKKAVDEAKTDNGEPKGTNNEDALRKSVAALEDELGIPDNERQSNVS